MSRKTTGGWVLNLAVFGMALLTVPQARAQAVAEIGSSQGGQPVAAVEPAPELEPVAAEPAEAEAGAAQGQGGTEGAVVDTSFNFSGDFRFRYENTTQQEPTSQPGLLDPRNRMVMRFRAGVTKRFNEQVGFGVRLATGSSDDPNTTDVTLGDFVNKPEISLTRAYIDFNSQGLFLTGGKFPNPFTTTELVWDGDVNPQGVAASYLFPEMGSVTPKLTAAYTIVDEQTTEPDSTMSGGQLEFLIAPSADWSFTVAGGYYDYEIRSLRNANAGDTLSNNLTPDGMAYLSDFDLMNTTAIFEHIGFGDNYPIRLEADYVKNLGAAVDEDSGIGFDIFLGRASELHDTRFRYGYNVAETDAVLAAFSNDNTTYPTNYVQHTVAFDYVVLESTILNATWYGYRRKDVPVGDENPYLSRLRLNVLVTF